MATKIADFEFFAGTDKTIPFTVTSGGSAYDATGNTVRFKLQREKTVVDVLSYDSAADSEIGWTSASTGVGAVTLSNVVTGGLAAVDVWYHYQIEIDTGSAEYISHYGRFRVLRSFFA